MSNLTRRADLDINGWLRLPLNWSNRHDDEAEVEELRRRINVELLRSSDRQIITLTQCTGNYLLRVASCN